MGVVTQQPPPPQGTQAPPGRQQDGFDRFIAGVRGLGLQRSNDRWIGGVCSGLAQRLGVDPLIVRAGFILLGLIFGTGVTLYLVLWLLLPDQRGDVHLERAVRHGDLAPIGILILTIVVLTSGFGLFWGWSGPGPLIPILVVAAVIWGYVAWRHNNPGPHSWQWPQPSPGQGAGFGSQPADNPSPYGGHQDLGAYTSSATSALADSASSTSPGPSGYPTGGYSSDFVRSGWSSTGQPPPAPVAFVPAPPRPRRRRLSTAFSLILLGLAAAVGGATSLGLQHTSHQDVAARLGFAAALLTLGLGVIIAGLSGRKTRFVCFVASLLTVLVALLTVVPKDLSLTGESGEVTWTPRTTQDVGPLHLSSGTAHLDLSALATPTSPVTIPLDVSLGSIIITVPAGLPVEVRAKVTIGTISADRAIEDETGVRVDSGGTSLHRTYQLGGQAPLVIVDSTLTVGEIHIERSTS